MLSSRATTSSSLPSWEFKSKCPLACRKKDKTQHLRTSIDSLYRVPCHLDVFSPDLRVILKGWCGPHVWWNGYLSEAAKHFSSSSRRLIAESGDVHGCVGETAEPDPQCEWVLRRVGTHLPSSLRNWAPKPRDYLVQRVGVLKGPLGIFWWGKKNLNNVSFLSQGDFFITPSFLRAPQGWAAVPGLLDMCSSHCQYWCLWCNSGVLHTHHCVLLPIPRGPPALRPEAWPWHVCVCVACSVVTTCVSSQTYVLYKACTANTVTSSSAHIMCPGKAVLLRTPETTQPNSQGWPLAVPYSCTHGFRVPFPKT